MYCIDNCDRYQGWAHRDQSTAPSDSLYIGPLMNDTETNYASKYKTKTLTVFTNNNPGSFVPRDYSLTQAIASAAGQSIADDCEDLCGSAALCNTKSEVNTY